MKYPVVYYIVSAVTLITAISASGNDIMRKQNMSSKIYRVEHEGDNYFDGKIPDTAKACPVDT